MVGEGTGVVVEELETVAPVAHVVFTAEEVKADEVTSEGFAEPVACLGLYHPVFPLFATREGPGVVVAREVEAPFRGELHFTADVDGQGRIVE